MKAAERMQRNESIKEEYRIGKSYEEIADKFSITSQMVRNIVKGKNNPKNRAILEHKVLEAWHNTQGVHRERVKQVSDILGVNKSQVRYIILKSWN